MTFALAVWLVTMD